MKNKIEINLILNESATALYWDGGDFVAEPHMFPDNEDKTEFNKAVKAALERFGEQPFEIAVVGWEQLPEIKKGESFTYTP